MTEPSPDQRLAAFLEGLDSLPPFHGLTFRGMPAAATTLTPQAPTLVTRGITSTSKDARLATADFTTAGVFVLASQTGKDISAFSADPSAGEVVFPPGTIVRAQWLDVGFPTVLLYDVVVRDGQVGLPPVLDADPTTLVQRVLDAARALPPVNRRDDRFIGDVW